MQIFQTDFPGLDQIDNFLPHTGKLFLKALSQFEQVDLEPEVPRMNLPRYRRVKISVLQHGQTFEIFPAEKNQLSLSLEIMKPRLPKFEFQGGNDLYRVVKQYATFLESRIAERLALFNFRLELSEECLRELKMEDDHQQYFGPGNAAPDFMRNQPAKMVQFRISTIGRKKFRGLEFPQRFLTCYWDRVIPLSGPYRNAIQLSAVWNYYWDRIKKDNLVSFLCESNWKDYQRHMLQFKEIYESL
jgi:hypothetical protein